MANLPEGRTRWALLGWRTRRQEERRVVMKSLSCKETLEIDKQKSDLERKENPSRLPKEK